jgi:AraC-like DNA-binding protein
MTLESKSRRKYLAINPSDQAWGLAINSVGRQTIAENEVYPPQEHPTRYLFNTKSGRILNEYQLLYITKGKGTFVSTSCGSRHIKEGQMFLIFPGEWHSYKPDESTGWNEYWIGFNGRIMDEWVKNGFFSKENVIFNIGLNEDLIAMYKRAIIIAEAQEANYQQALSGIVCNLISMALYLSRNKDFNQSNITSQINTAKVAVHENISTITPEGLAQAACMSYSKFRKIFKEYTGFAPAQYIQEVRINIAKEMLTNTSKSIKEIAFELGYENKDYFFTVFKKVTSMTPISYREHTQGIDIQKQKW